MSDGPDGRVQRRKPRAWSKADDAELARLIEGRQPPGEIAKRLDRTVDAIRGRAAQLHLVLPSSLRPWRKTIGRTPVIPAQGRRAADRETDGES
jgi:hypothetical protein